MTTTIIIYDAAGKILRMVEAPASMAAQQAQEGEFFLLGEADDTLNYIDQGEVLARPVCPVQLDKTQVIADGVDAITFGDVPADARLTVERIDEAAMLAAIKEGRPREYVESALASGDTLQIDVAGTYRAVVSCWPYLDKAFVIDAN